MSRHLINSAKIGGIAILYAILALTVCRTAHVLLWEPFRSLYKGHSADAWPRFVRYYELLVLIMTALSAFLAGRSYRPAAWIAGTITGTIAALLFRLGELTGYSPGRGPGIMFTVLVACLVGMMFGCLGGLSVSRGRAQPGAAPEPPPADAVRDAAETMNPKLKSEAPADGGGR